ncbi:MAG: ABC transporter ATP-binding protein [Planctomycetota bacterium]
MPRHRRSSRDKFGEYRRLRAERPPEQRVHGVDEHAQERQKSKRNRPFSALAVEFWKLLRGHRPILAAALGTLTVSTLFGLALPASSKVVIDFVLTDSPGPSGIPQPVAGWLGEWATNRYALLWVISGVMLAITAVTVVFHIWGRWHTTRLTKRLQVALRRKVFDHAVHLPLHTIHRLKSGGAASVLREDAGGVADLLFSMVYNPWRAVTQLIGTLVVLAWLDWKLLMMAFAVIPLVVITHRTWINRIRPVWRDIRSSRSAIDAHATEAFGGMRVVRAFGRERGEGGRFVGANHFMARQEFLAWWWSRILEIVWQVLIPVGSAGVLVYGGYGVLNGSLTIGDVMAFSVYLLWLLGPIESLVGSAASIQNNLAGFDRVLDLLEEDTEFAEKPGDVVLEAGVVEGRVTIEGMGYAYPPRSKGDTPADVLLDVSLDVPPGTTVALVGASGAGKTTLCNLIARFDDPKHGRILLDGRDIRDIKLESYRSLLGVVEQDVFLFDGTVAENIAYAHPGASMGEVQRAARAAAADRFIEELDRGYDTLIGERGVRLSGGQKQRVAIARAILADPRILILDEATSNLDTESERLIQASLEDLLRTRTSFVIAHRLSTIRHADIIVVLEEGQIVESGSHDELVARGGRYEELLNMQLEQSASDTESDASAGAA